MQFLVLWLGCVAIEYAGMVVAHLSVGFGSVVKRKGLRVVGNVKDLKLARTWIFYDHLTELLISRI
jgi:hypothetical protein